MKRFTFGLIAEYIAAFIYIMKFYRILHHRKRNYSGEIDLIALRNKTIVFIEVKARKSDYDDVLVSKTQQKRIKRAAEVFLSQNTKYKNYNARFDLIVVRPYKFPLIIQNAW